jgi:hypothetical protein
MKAWLRQYSDELFTTRALVLFLGAMSNALAFGLVDEKRKLVFDQQASQSFSKPTVAYLVFNYLGSGLFALTFASCSLLLASSLIQRQAAPETLLRYPNAINWVLNSFWKLFLPRLLALFTIAMVCYGLVHLVFFADVTSMSNEISTRWNLALPKGVDLPLGAWQLVWAYIADILAPVSACFIFLGLSYVSKPSSQRLQVLTVVLIVFIASPSAYQSILMGLNVAIWNLSVSPLVDLQSTGLWWVSLAIWLGIGFAATLARFVQDQRPHTPAEPKYFSVRSRWMFLVSAFLVTVSLVQICVRRMPIPLSFNWRFSMLFAGQSYGVYSALISIFVVLATALLCRNMSLPLMGLTAIGWAATVLGLSLEVYKISGGAFTISFLGLRSSEGVALYLGGFFLALVIHWLFFALLGRLGFKLLGPNLTGVLLILAVTFSWMLPGRMAVWNPFDFNLVPVGDASWLVLLGRLSPTFIAVLLMATAAVWVKIREQKEV